MSNSLVPLKWKLDLSNPQNKSDLKFNSLVYYSNSNCQDSKERDCRSHGEHVFSIYKPIETKDGANMLRHTEK